MRTTVTDTVVTQYQTNRSVWMVYIAYELYDIDG